MLIAAGETCGLSVVMNSTPYGVELYSVIISHGF